MPETVVNYGKKPDKDEESAIKRLHVFDLIEDNNGKPLQVCTRCRARMPQASKKGCPAKGA